MEEIALLLSSSDNTADVGSQIARAIYEHWPDCPYTKYVGLTTDRHCLDFQGWIPLVAGANAGWREELKLSLLALPPNISHVLLVLDDFLFLKVVDTKSLKLVIDEALSRRLAYVRLKPVERSVVGGLIYRFRRDTTHALAGLGSTEPYQSSLQAALWRKDYLLRALGLPGTIWDFEHQTASEPHFAVTQPGLLRYRHVVERGRWMPNAERSFALAGVPFKAGARSMWGTWHRVTSLRKCVQFGIFGYLGYRVRRALERLSP